PVVHALVANQLLQELDGLSGQRRQRPGNHGVCLVRNSLTRRIDSARWVGARQSFWTSRFGASAAISSLVFAGCGVSLPGWSRSGVGHFLTKSRLTEKTKSPPNMLSPNFLMTSSVSDGSRARIVLANPLTLSSQVWRFSWKPTGFCSTAAAMRSGAISQSFRQKEEPMQPPIT